MGEKRIEKATANQIGSLPPSAAIEEDETGHNQQIEYPTRISNTSSQNLDHVKQSFRATRTVETGTLSSITQRQEEVYSRRDKVQNQDKMDSDEKFTERPTLESYTGIDRAESKRAVEKTHLGGVSKSQTDTPTVGGGTDQHYQANYGQQADLKSEELGQEISNRTTACSNVVLVQSLVRNMKSRSPLHITSREFMKTSILRAVLKSSIPSTFEPVQVRMKHDIYIDDQEDRSVKMILPKVLCVHFEEAAVDEMREMREMRGTRSNSTSSSSSGAEIINEYLKEKLNHQLNSGDSEMLEYSGDDESAKPGSTMKDENGNGRKLYRKKYGSYPQYRIRLNGVIWETIFSSDEDTDDEGTVQRGSRKSSKTKNETHKKLKDAASALNSSCVEGDGEESEPVVVHVVSSMKRKVFSKRKRRYEEVDTTASEASDVGSLTDCSLCLSDS